MFFIYLHTKYYVSKGLVRESITVKISEFYASILVVTLLTLSTSLRRTAIFFGFAANDNAFKIKCEMVSSATVQDLTNAN
jgi:hypothetical protein